MAPRVPSARMLREAHFVWTRRALAIVLVVVGIVWIAQGSGALHGSFMTGHAIWSVIGAVAVLAGVVILIGSTRRRTPVDSPDD